ncbi:hypothetical protein GCM10010411_53480 [Actinomadura fulvescens]|uniref:Transposase n=1 Tax=Actinomadura fulvescens TaxID=46160 RepID=A0ABP6CEN3_9ACTN
MGWVTLHRRLARDYNAVSASVEAMIRIGAIDNLSAHNRRKRTNLASCLLEHTERSAEINGSQIHVRLLRQLL